MSDNTDNTDNTEFWRVYDETSTLTFHEPSMIDMWRIGKGLMDTNHRATVASISQPEAVMHEALARMDRARSILTGGNPRPDCNWGMLDTSDLRAALATATEPTDEQYLTLALHSPDSASYMLPVHIKAAIERGKARYAAFLAAAPQ